MYAVDLNKQDMFEITYENDAAMRVKANFPF